MPILKPVLKYLNGVIVKEFPSMKDAAASIGAKNSTGVSYCCNGHQSTTGGFGFAFKNAADKIVKKQIRKKFNKYDQTSVDCEHFHKYKIDDNRDGKTVKTFYSKSHTHKIIDGIVEIVKKHRHKLL